MPEIRRSSETDLRVASVSISISVATASRLGPPGFREDNASRAASSMSSRYAESSRGINDPRGFQDRLPANVVSAPVDRGAVHQIDSAGEQLG